MAVPEDIRELTNRVPSPPGESLPPGASEDDVRGFTERTGVAVPADLRDWWRWTNGPCIGPGGMYGVRPRRAELDVEGAYRHYPAWKDRRWIPVAADGCGNDYVLAADGSLGPSLSVFFFDHEKGDPLRNEYVVASGLWPFLRFLLRRELGERGWPFDRSFVVESDPLIVACGMLPWDADGARADQ